MAPNKSITDGGNSNPIEYLTVEEVYGIHSEIIEQDEEATPGILDEGSIEFALDSIKHGHYGRSPGTVIEKAAHLMRLIARRHEFADGNKRTALYTTEEFLDRNGYEFDYNEDVVDLLVNLSKGDDMDTEDVVKYIRRSTTSK